MVADLVAKKADLRVSQKVEKMAVQLVFLLAAQKVCWMVGQKVFLMAVQLEFLLAGRMDN